MNLEEGILSDKEVWGENYSREGEGRGVKTNTLLYKGEGGDIVYI